MTGDGETCGHDGWCTAPVCSSSSSWSGVVTWRVIGARSTYEQALSQLPKSTLRTTFTDWAAVREQARGEDLDARSSRGEVDAFTTRAYDRDLTGGSALAGSTYALARRFGFSPLTAQWEAFGQSPKGQVDVLKLKRSADMPAIVRALVRLGYEKPDREDGTWVGGADLVAGIDGELTPVQQNLVVFEDERLVLMSDNAAYVSAAAEVVRGDADALTDEDGVASLAGVVGDPVAAVQWTSTFVCEDLSMGQADEEDQRVADDLVRKAGKTSPLAGFVMAQGADRSLAVGLHFESDDQASANLQTRVDLASGDAPGQGGSFAERFSITSGEADGADVVLRLKPRGDAVLSDLSSGPLLFATC